MTATIWAGVHTFGTLMSAVLMYIAFKKTSGKESAPLILEAACCIIVMITQTQIIYCADPDVILTLSKLQYIGKCFIIYFGLSFLRRWKKLNIPDWFMFVLLVINFSALSIVLGYHWLYFKDWYLVPDSQMISGVTMVFKGTIIRKLYTVFQGLQLLLFTGHYFLSIKKGKNQNRQTSKRVQYIMLVAYFLPATFVILPDLSDKVVSDHTPIFIMLAVSVWTFLLTFGNVFTVVSQAKESLMDNLREPFFVLNESGKILYSNNSGDTLMDSVITSAGDTAALTPDTLGQMLLNTTTNTEKSLSLVNTDYRIQSSVITDNGKRIGYSFTFVDVSELTRRNQEMEAMKNAAEAASKAKSDFVSTISHEIRTPMNVIVGMTDILLRENPTGSTREYLYNIKTSGQNLLAIINDILDVSKIESGRMTLVEEEYTPDSLFNDLSLMMLNRIGNKEIDLLYDIDPAMPSGLWGDMVRIRQIILNLMNNAIKFTEKGYVKLSVRITGITPKSDESPMDTASLLISVEDSGCGIRQEDLQKLFREFSQVDEAAHHHQEGTGLGLALSQKLAGLMNSHIYVESEYGKGSRFYFTLSQGVCNGTISSYLREEKYPDGMPSVCYADFADGSEDYLGDMLLNLFEEYSLPVVDFTDVRSGRCYPDYLFFRYANYESVLDSLPGDIGSKTKLYTLWNPTLGTCTAEYASSVNVPLYSIPFCRLLNGETVDTLDSVYVQDYIVRGGRLLLVDDNDMNRIVARTLIEPLGMEIEEAEDGAKAVAAVQTHLPYDIILMDHMMPVMDGIEATKAIRAIDDPYCKNVPIIALTADLISEVREGFITAGANDFATKPINVASLFSALKNLLPPEKVVPVSGEIPPLSEESSHSSEGFHVNTVEADRIAELQSKLGTVGIIVTDGIAASGSLETYENMLKIFCGKVQGKSALIKEQADSEDLNLFTIEVHALKNNARIIGHSTLSELFFTLEKAGREGNRSVIEENLPDALSMMDSIEKALIPIVSEANESISSAEENPLSKAEITELLQVLHDSMDTFDLDSADDAVRQLVKASASLPAGITPKHIQELQIMVGDVNIDDVLSMTEQLLKDLGR